MSGERDWLVWQLADSAFPMGAFAHSSGLESAWQQGMVRNRVELREWVLVSLRQIARSALPLVNAAYEEPDRLTELDQHCDAFTSNHVANRASRLQGRAFWAAAKRIFKANLADPSPDEPCHLAPVFGMICQALGLAPIETVRLFVFLHLRGVLAAAVRLNIIGPMESQALQFELLETAEAVVMEGAQLDLLDLAQTAPLLDLWHGGHDRLPSRLFQT